MTEPAAGPRVLVVSIRDAVVPDHRRDPRRRRARAVSFDRVPPPEAGMPNSRADQERRHVLRRQRVEAHGERVGGHIVIARQARRPCLLPERTAGRA